MPRVWKKFWHLREFDMFDLGGKTQYSKTSTFTAEYVACPGAGGGERTRWLWPWTKVRTTEFVRDALPGGKTSMDFGPTQPLKPEQYLDRPRVEQPTSDNNIHGPTS